MALTDRIVIVITLVSHLSSEELKALYKFENYLIIFQNPERGGEAAARGTAVQPENPHIPRPCNQGGWARGHCWVEGTWGREPSVVLLPR